MKKHQIALEMYTVRTLAMPDMIGTLKQVREIGYTAVEFAGYGGVPVKELRTVLDDLGIKVTGSHVPLADFENRPDGVIEDLHTLGAENAIVPWIAPDKREAFFSDLNLLSDTFNAWGRKFKDAGLRFGYHHHDFEFEPVPGGDGTRLDAMMANTDPELVFLQLDAFWAAFAGRDPIELLKKFSGRISTLHAKELLAPGSKADLPVGAGILPWKEIIPAAEAAGASWAIVEMDVAPDPIADITASLNYLESILD
jgi:sugar phosphate isomerase/epimerase